MLNFIDIFLHLWWWRRHSSGTESEKTIKTEHLTIFFQIEQSKFLHYSFLTNARIMYMYICMHCYSFVRMHKLPVLNPPPFWISYLKYTWIQIICFNIKLKNWNKSELHFWIYFMTWVFKHQYNTDTNYFLLWTSLSYGLFVELDIKYFSVGTFFPLLRRILISE